MILKSFGFKYGSPRANYYFDVSFVKNPARQENWSLDSMADESMRQFIIEQEKASEFIERVVPMIEFLNTLDGGVVVAFGCNAGRHRSVILVEEVALRLKERGVEVYVTHTDL